MPHIIGMKITIRASITNSYHDCARRASIQIIRDAIRDAGYDLRNTMPSVGAAVGKGAHAGAAHIMVQKRTGAQAHRDDWENIAIDEMRRGMTDGVTYDNTTPSATDGEKQIRAILRDYSARIAPEIEPDRIEEKRDPAKAVDGVYITGTSDVETIDNNICDYKTGIYRPCHTQQGIYSLLRRTYGAETRGVAVIHMPRTRLTKPYPGASWIRYDRQRCERLAWVTIQHIARDIRAFLETQNPQVLPCNPMSMMCNPKYCRAHGTAFCEITQGA